MYTPQAIAQKRKLAASMLQQGLDSSPIRSPWQGLARIANAMLGGSDLYKADQQEKALLGIDDSAQANGGPQPGVGNYAAAPTPTANGAAGTKGSTDQLALGDQIRDYFVGKGMTPTQASALAGKMVWENGGDPNNVIAWDNIKHSPTSPHSAGIGQWNDRLPALVDFAKQQGVDVPEGNLRDPKVAKAVISSIPLNTQLDFAWSELNGPEGRAMAMLKASPDDLVADNKGAISYHRPAGWTPSKARAGQSPTQIADSGQIQTDAGPEQTPYGEVSAPGTTQAPQEAQPKQLPQGAAGFNQQGRPMYVNPRFLQRPPRFTQAQIG
jgi:hypothetical protein